MNKSIVGILLLLICFSCSKRVEMHSAQLEALYKEIYPLFKKDLDSALLLTDSALLMARKNNFSMDEAHSLYIKGYVYSKQGDLASAFVHYLKSALLCKKIGTKESKTKFAELSINLSRILTTHYKYDEALEITHEGFTLTIELGLKFQEQKLKFNEAIIHWKSGELDKSLLSLKESVHIAHSFQDTTRVLKCFMLFGLIHKDGKQYHEARKYYQHVLNHPKASTTDLAKANQNMAVSYMEEGNYKEAKHYFHQALTFKKNIDDARLLYSTMHDLGDWHLTHGSIDSARFYGEQAAALYPQLIREPETFKVFQLLRKVAFAQQDILSVNQMADSAHQEALRFHETVENIMKERDQFQIDLILSGLKAEKAAEEAQRSSERYRWITIIGGILAILVIVGWKIWFKRWRTNLWSKIYGMLKNVHLAEPYQGTPFDGL